MEEIAKGTQFEQLPQHLQEAIFAQLPPPKVLQLRRVSTFWNVALRSRQVVERSCQAERWIVMAKFRGRELDVGGKLELLAYIPSRHKIHVLRPILTACLGPNASPAVFVSSKHHDHIFNVANVALCGAADAGLLCCLAVHKHRNNLSCFSIHSYSVLVFNPLTRAICHLPPLPRPCRASQLFTSIHASSHCKPHYYVIVCDDMSQMYYNQFVRLQVYNSRAGYWKIAKAQQEAEVTASLATITVGDLFYWNVENNENRDWLYSYDAGQDKWSKISLYTTDTSQSLTPSHLQHSAPVGYTFNYPWHIDHGRVLQLGKGGRILGIFPLTGYPTYCVGFGVFELSKMDPPQDKVTWTLISHTPVTLWQTESHRSDLDICYTCVTDGACIYITGRNRSVHRPEYRVPLVYDVVQDSWYRLPRAYRYIALSSFQPSLISPIV